MVRCVPCGRGPHSRAARAPPGGLSRVSGTMAEQGGDPLCRELVRTAVGADFAAVPCPHSRMRWAGEALGVGPGAPAAHTPLPAPGPAWASAPRLGLGSPPGPGCEGAGRTAAAPGPKLSPNVGLS